MYSPISFFGDGTGGVIYRSHKLYKYLNIPYAYQSAGRKKCDLLVRNKPEMYSFKTLAVYKLVFTINMITDCVNIILSCRKCCFVNNNSTNHIFLQQTNVWSW